MSTRTAIPGARSYLGGDLTKDEIVAMAKLFGHPRVRAAAIEEAEEIEDYAADAILYEGDLTIDGDFDTGDTGSSGEAEGTLLVVKGNLTVCGLYRDACNDAPDLVLVTGDLRAEDVITASHLEVRGNVVVANVVVGDFNDGAARIGGDLSARLFAPTDHHFDVAGSIRADYFVEGSNDCKSKTCAPGVAWIDVPLATFGFSAEDPDVAKIIKRLRERAPVLR